jgi:CyaY protein
MTEAEYHQKAEETLLAIEESVDRAGADIELERVADILTFEFENGSKIIVNKHSAVQQLWVATKSGGFHYGFDDATQTWRNDKTGAELMQELSAFASQQAGTAVRL